MEISVAVKALLDGEPVSASKLNKRLVNELIDEGLLFVYVHGSRKSYKARNIDALKRYLIDKDERYRILETQSSESRASMATNTGNSKLKTVRSCPGFPVNSYEDIVCSLGGKEITIHPPEGSFQYICLWEEFKIPTDVIVIGIENMENFRWIHKQRQFFQDYLQQRGFPTKAIFVSRYPQSTDLRNWLCSIPNYYLHFGDFDLAGINIFLAEFRQYIGKDRTSFLIPDDIALRLKTGSGQRYDTQYERFKSLRSDDNDLQKLINLIHSERKGYDQEGYIEI